MLNNFITVSLQVISIFILVLIGYICGKTKILTQNAIKPISDLVLYVATPCAILQAFCTEEKATEKTLNLLFVFMIAVFVHIIGIIIAKFCIKSDNEESQKVLRFAVVFSNCGYMSFPLQKALLGEIGVFYGAMFVAVFNIFMWTYGAKLFTNDRSVVSIKKILLNPVIIATTVSVLLYVLQISLPSVLGNAVTHLSNLNTPLPMIIVGFYLSGNGIGKAFSDKRVYIPTLLRLIVIPLVSLIIMKVLQISDTALIACTVAASASTAAGTAMFAAKFDSDAESAVNMITVTTLLCIITMPVFVMLAQI